MTPNNFDVIIICIFENRNPFIEGFLAVLCSLMIIYQGAYVKKIKKNQHRGVCDIIQQS